MGWALVGLLYLAATAVGLWGWGQPGPEGESLATESPNPLKPAHLGGLIPGADAPRRGACR